MGESDAPAVSGGRAGPPQESTPAALARAAPGAALDVGEIASQLASSSADATAAGLSALRTQTRLHADDLGDYGEASVAVNDRRLRIARECCAGAAGSAEVGSAGEGDAPRTVLQLVVDAWELAEQRSLSSLRPLALQVLAQLLALLSVHQPDHRLGDAVVEQLLDPAQPWMDRLRAYLALSARSARRDGATADVVTVLVALKLLTSMALYARGKLASVVWERFHWSAGLHARLLAMRRRSRGAGAAAKPVSLHDADIRTEYIMFLTALLAQPFNASLKSTVLDIGADGIPVVLRGLVSDPPEVVQHVLLVVHQEVFKDAAVSRGCKARFLNEAACSSLVKLYARENDAVDGGSATVADMAHHFLLSVATHPGFGICFADRGWYGRADGGAGDAADSTGAGAGSGTHLFNRTLSGVLRQLAVADDLRQQELALRILRACPELVASYVAYASRTLALEPRADTAWLASVAFLGRVMALPLPDMHGEPVPPPLPALLGNTAPDFLRSLSRALRDANALVQYTATLLLAQVLQRAARTREAMERAAAQLEEGPGGAWTSALQAVELAGRTRFPDVDSLAPLVERGGNTASPGAVMQQEAALRVLALYHVVLPGMTFDTRYDAGKLLTGAFFSAAQHASLESGAAARGGSDAPLRMDRLGQIHALQIVARSTESAFDWTEKVRAPWPGCAARSYVHFLLLLFCHTPLAPLRDSCGGLLQRLLAGSALFLTDANELHAWLAALPRQAAVDDDCRSLLNFWDDCLMRALKTPYRYAERMRELVSAHDAHGEAAVPSPLLVCMMEQASVRLAKGLFDTAHGADANASAPVIAYMGRLLVELAALQKPVAALHAVYASLAAAASSAPPATQASLQAVRRLLGTLAAPPAHAHSRFASGLRDAVAAAVASGSDDALAALDPASDNLWTVVDALSPAERAAVLPLLVLHSRPENYVRLAEIVGAGRVWPLFWTVLLHRVRPDSRMPPIAATFDALDRWGAHCRLGADDLRVYVMENQAVTAWLSRTTETAHFFVQRLARHVSLSRDAADAAWRACLAPLVHRVVQLLGDTPSDAGLLTSAGLLANVADGESRVRIVHILLPALVSRAHSHVEQLHTLRTVVDAARAEPMCATLTEVRRHLPELLSLLDNTALRAAALRLMHTVLQSALPPALDGVQEPACCGTLATLHSVQSSVTAVTLVPLLRCPPDAYVDAVLMRILYAVPHALRIVRKAWEAHCPPLQDYLFSTVALLERTAVLNEPLGTLTMPIADALLPLLFSADASAACRGVVFLLRAGGDARDMVTARLASEMHAAPMQNIFQGRIAWVLAQITAGDPTHAPTVLAPFVDASLRWIVRRYAEDSVDAGPFVEAVRAFRSLLRTHSEARSHLRSHLVDPVVAAVLQHRSESAPAVSLAQTLVEYCSVGHAASVRHINMVLSRTELLSGLRMPTTESGRALRQATVSLLVSLLRTNMDALNAPSTLSRTLFLYTGTLSAQDRALFGVLLRHEAESRHSLLEVLQGWAADQRLVPSALQKDTLLAALLSLSPHMTQATCVRFPRGSHAGGRPRVHVADDENEMYDPWLVLNLVGGAIMERELQEDNAYLTGLEWLAILRTGAMGVLVCALSAHRAALRRAALVLLGKVYACLQHTSFRERDLVILVLERLRDAVPPPPATSVSGTYETPPWLPSMPLLFLAQCLRAVGAPHLPLFPLLYRFLLQRARFDPYDVPLLYNLLFSASDQLQEEQVWLFRFLHDALEAHARGTATRVADGIARAKTEWRIFTRRHVWDLLLSRYDGMASAANVLATRSAQDGPVRARAQLESIFSTATAIPSVAQSLVTRRGFLQWIAMHVSLERSMSPARAAYWITLLANICEAHVYPARGARVLRHLQAMDRRMDGAFVASVAQVAADALRLTGEGAAARGPAPPAMEQHAAPDDGLPPWLPAACALLHVLLDYTALCGDASGPYAALEAGLLARVAERIAAALLQRARLEDVGRLVLDLTQSVLVLSTCAQGEDTRSRVAKMYAELLPLAMAHETLGSSRKWALQCIAP
ncbi:hypothetical protein MSPP1_000799 [Malassezia sp. CBS 17886]|nr:hypothetical protein MSPP1_000799 [Malassezia sp. CBS 17886]